MEQDQAYIRACERMVEEQIRRRGLDDGRLLEAFHAVPRHLFVPEMMRSVAYEDHPVRIGQGQTISQPYIVAFMTNLLGLNGEENVLEVGTGSGYQAAILAHLAKSIHTVERYPELAKEARRTLELLNINNVFVHVGDGSLGWEKGAPYQGIVVTAAAPRAPQPLLNQLDDGGSLVIPIGDRFMQDLYVWQRHGDDFSSRQSIGVAFVPLRGENGWQEDEWIW
jgi:protein-L-isoaspartate(D-aspartate) O-methyltransferase